MAEYNRIEPAVRAQATQELEAAVAKIDKPNGVKSEAEALARQTEVNSRKDLSYVSPKAPQTAEIVGTIKSLQEKLDEMVKGRVVEGREWENIFGLRQLEELVAAKEKKVSEMAKTLDDQWQKRMVGSAELQALQAEYDRTLEIYKIHYPNYENAKSAFLADLDRQGRRKAEFIIKQTPELLGLRAKSQAAKRTFLAAKAKRDEAKLTEGFRKALAELSDADQWLDTRRRFIGITQQDLAVARQSYIKAMQAAGEPVPLTIEAYNIYDLFNRDLDEVRAHLERDRFFLQAMISFISRWDSFMAELRRKHNLLPKDESGY